MIGQTLLNGVLDVSGGVGTFGRVQQPQCDLGHPLDFKSCDEASLKSNCSPFVSNMVHDVAHI